ncbi:MAG: transporter [Acidimicrobiales bacterium]
MLAILNRPTVADSSCVAPPGRVVLEAGYQAVDQRGPEGSGFNFPELELSFGLPDRNELILLPPNYLDQFSGGPAPSRVVGYGPTSIGFRREIVSTSLWQLAAEEIVTLPSGDPNYGSDGWGSATNAIVSIGIGPHWGIAFMGGVTSEVAPANSGGRRFTSFNPDWVVTYAWDNRYQFYGEIYGQSKIAPGLGSGFDADGGFQYLITPHIEVDAELGQRISGGLGGFDNYVGVGFGLEFPYD